MVNYIGYLDNESKNFNQYTKRLKRKGLNLLCKDNSSTQEEILSWLINNEIKCFMVDYKLKPEFNYEGTSLLFYIKNKLPDLPCIILTNYTEDSLRDNLVEDYLIFDRLIFDKDGAEFDKFTSSLEKCIRVFDKRIRLRVKNYEELYLKKEKGQLSSLENEEFVEEYSLLRSYGLVDDIPVKFLDSDVEKKLDDLLSETDQLLK